MIQTQQHSLSDPEIETLKEWLISPGATIFLKCIRSEQAYQQAEAGVYYMSRHVEGKDNENKAKFFADRANELQFILDKFTAMIGEEEPYEFKTATLTP